MSAPTYPTDSATGKRLKRFNAVRREDNGTSTKTGYSIQSTSSQSQIMKQTADVSSMTVESFSGRKYVVFTFLYSVTVHLKM